MNHTPAPLKRRLTALLYESLLVGAVTMLAGALAGGCTTLMQQFTPALLPVSSWLTVGLLLGAWWLYFRLNWVREKQTLPMRVWHIGLADAKSSLHPALCRCPMFRGWKRAIGFSAAAFPPTAA